MLSSFSLYWLSAFVLPKSILHKVNALSNKFLWESSTIEGKIHIVSIEKVCMSKALGGLGIKDIKVWKKGHIVG